MQDVLVGKRTAIPHKLQQTICKKYMLVTLWQLGLLNAVGPRVGESHFCLIEDFVYHCVV